MERISYQEVPNQVFEKLRAIEDYLESSGIDKHLMELIKLRVSQINNCAYCVDMHHKELLHIGETALRLSSICVWEETPYFSEEERAVLQFSDALTRLREPTISDELFNPLLTYYNKEEICFLTLAISQINTWNRLMKTFGFVPGNYQVQKTDTNEN